MRVQLPHPAETASAAGGALRYTYQATSAAPNELLRRRHPEIRGLEADLNRSVFVYSFDREPDADIAGFITRVAQPLKTILRRGQTSWGVFSAAHPREAPAMRDAARQFVRDYSRLTRATSDAQRTLKRRVGAAKVVSKQAVLDELGKLIPATAPWPRVQQQVSVAQREIAGINGDEINFEQSMIYFSWIFPEMVKQYDTLSFLGVAPAQVVAQGWRDAFRLAWFEHIEAVSGAISQDPAASLPDREVLIADALDMFKAGNISAHSELEDCYYETAKGLAQPLSAALPLTPYPICGEGIMYLDKENRPVSVFEGGDCVALAQTLSVRFNPYSINDRWFPGEQPVFCDPVFSGNGNALQLQAYLEDMDKLNRLPGMPRPLFAAVSPDVVTVYRLVPGVTQAQVYQLLDRSLNVVRIGHTLRDLFDRHINDFPVEAGTNAKMVDDVTKNRARSLASAVADQVVARIPELAQRGISSGTISEIFKADLAELRGLKIGKRREAGQVSRGELQKRIVQLAIRIEMYLSERLAEDIFRDQAYFEIVEIPGLTNAPACRGELDALVGEVNGFLGGSVDLDATAFEARVAPFEARVAAMLQANGQWASVKEALGAVRAHIDAVRQARALTQQYGTSLVTGVDERGALAEIRGVYDRLD
ncbi:MAG: hypothetical protein WCG78_08685, partial [Candidatus Omnitrophota bacterium]